MECIIEVEEENLSSNKTQGKNEIINGGYFLQSGSFKINANQESDDFNRNERAQNIDRIFDNQTNNFNPNGFVGNIDLDKEKLSVCFGKCTSSRDREGSNNNTNHFKKKNEMFQDGIENNQGNRITLCNKRKVQNIRSGRPQTTRERHMIKQGPSASLERLKPEFRSRSDKKNKNSSKSPIFSTGDSKSSIGSAKNFRSFKELFFKKNSLKAGENQNHFFSTDNFRNSKSRPQEQTPQFKGEMKSNFSSESLWNFNRKAKAIFKVKN